MSSEVLQKLRDLMKNTGFKSSPIQALIITNHDEHMSGYLAEKDQRLKYVTGFSGSAGTAIITDIEANLWTDDRYFLQAVKEIDSNWKLMKAGLQETSTESEWLSKNLCDGSLVGTDPKLISFTVWNNLKEYLVNFGISLVPLEYNFVDEIWENKPILPFTTIKVHDKKFTGRPLAFKLGTVWKTMKEKSVDTLIVTALDDIAWLLNLRGEDIKFNPVFFSFLVIGFNEIHLFIDEKKVTNSVENYFVCDILIKIHPYDSFYSLLVQMEAKINLVWICKDTNYKIFDIFPKYKRYSDVSPISKLKAVKNEVEIEGMIGAHIKDGIALCRYFSWLENEILIQALTEISAAKMLECFRMDEEDYVGLSFDTISSAGSNAAIIHYNPPSEESNKVITIDEIYLCDSGGQYLDGTTNVTRTLHFGKPTDFQKECFTRVLKGAISIATLKFPYGIKGNALDSFARKALWEVGLNYGHGTGHGIGSYLCVHEGPIGITSHPLPDDPGLQANMFLSNEPGYYHNGEFGIRIKNIVRTVPIPTVYGLEQDSKGYLTFRTITMCPIQTKMLNISLLTENEICYLNDYHRKVRDTLGPILLKRHFLQAYLWLQKETEAIIR